MRVGRRTLSPRYAGANISFLRHPEKAAETTRHNVRSILNALGRRRIVGRQEDSAATTLFANQRSGMVKPPARPSSFGR